MYEHPVTDFLFPSGGYFIGAGSILNIAGSYYEYNSTDGDADARAIGSDWAMVGKDIADALEQFSKAHPSLTDAK